MLKKKWEKKIGKRQLHAFSLFLFLFLFLLLKSKENGFFALIRMNENSGELSTYMIIHV